MDALLVVDVQTALITGAYREAEVLEAINRTIEKVRARDGLIVFIQHCHASFEPLKRGSPGWQVHPALDSREGDCFIEKEASDAFYETDLELKLQQREVDRVFVVGLQTEYCVDATCRAALSHDFSVTLVSDAHTTGDSLLEASRVIAHHNSVLANLAHPRETIQLTTSHEI